jgi:hypothetical protein
VPDLRTVRKGDEQGARSKEQVKEGECKVQKIQKTGKIER